MKAVYIKEFGGIENLEILEVDDLSRPVGDEVLIRVKAAGLNRADIIQRKGFYPAPLGFPERIPGLEFAGEVFEIGENVTNFRIGDKVFGIISGGGQAEFVKTNQSEIIAFPDHLSFAEAACFPEAFITANDAIFTQAKLQKGESLLIHAVGSGVGLAALQLAKANGIKVFGTSRSAEKLERCKDFGLDVGILVGEEAKFADVANGIDVVLDLVGAKYFGENLNCLALKGRMILVGLTSGTKADFDLGIALRKRLKIIGTVLRSRTGEEKAEAAANFSRDVLPLIDARRLVANLDKVFDVSNIREAHKYLESNESFGKVVLEF
jgi:NADPH:quinone reductase